MSEADFLEMRDWKTWRWWEARVETGVVEGPWKDRGNSGCTEERAKEKQRIHKARPKGNMWCKK